MKLSQESREKISKALRGKPKSYEHRRKLSIVNTGKRHSDETKRRVSLSSLGRKHTEESKRKISQGNLGKSKSPEHIANMRIAFKNRRKMSDEHKSKISKTLTGRKLAPEHIAKISVANVGRKWSDKSRQKASKTRRGKKHTQEAKEKIRRAMLGRSSPTKGLPAWNRGLRAGDHPSILSGDRIHNWKGGNHVWIGRLRRTSRYISWRKGVLSRDNKTCQKHGVRCQSLVAHHIRNFTQYPEGRFDISNGITLCKNSHGEFHQKYGNVFNSLSQLEEFLGRKFQPTASRSDTDSGNACDTDAIASPLREDSTARHNIERPRAVSELAAETKVAA